MGDGGDGLAGEEGEVTIQDGVLGEGIVDDQLSSLCSDPHGVENTTHGLNPGFGHSERLCACVCVLAWSLIVLWSQLYK